jgi:hypothetical protein
VADGYQAPSRPRRRRGRRLLIVTLVLLVLLLVGLVIADRAGASYAQRRIADQVATELTKQGVRSARPDVTVHGVPFTTQVVSGTYQRVEVRLRDLTTDNPATLPENLRVQTLDVQARDVSAPLRTLRTGEGDIVARTVEGTALIDYASVARLAGQRGVQLREQGGRLAVTAPVEVLGIRLTVDGIADLTVVQGAVRVRFRELAARDLPDLPGAQAVVNGFAQQLSFDLNLAGLPFDLAVQEVRALPEGLRLRATASDVPLNRVSR